METFCLVLVNNHFRISFTLDLRKKTPNTYRAYLYFIPKRSILGFPRYPIKTHENIESFIGTCISRVVNIKKHIPRFKFLFGRQSKCIYTRQPKQKNFQKMESSSVGSNPARSLLASCFLSFHADSLKSNLTHYRGLAKITQLGKRQTEDLKVPSSILGFQMMHSTLSAQVSRHKGNFPASKNGM